MRWSKTQVAMVVVVALSGLAAMLEVHNRQLAGHATRASPAESAVPAAVPAAPPVPAPEPSPPSVPLRLDERTG